MKRTGKVGAPKPAPVAVADPIDSSNGEWEMHPDDRKLRTEARVYAKTHGAYFLDAAKGQLLQLVTTYSDAEAHALLDTLREKFWGGGWGPVPERTGPLASLSGGGSDG